jgi:hypothetical protein
MPVGTALSLGSVVGASDGVRPHSEVGVIDGPWLISAIMSSASAAGRDRGRLRQYLGVLGLY